MEFSSTATYIIFFLSTLLLYCLTKKAKLKQKQKVKLPPGSMGLPYFGETLHFYSQDPNVLFVTKQKRFLSPPYCKLLLHVFFCMILEYTCTRKEVWFVLSVTILCRYGDIFKTHILGCPCVMLASPEAARFVLVTHANLFKPTYPKSKERLIGPSALFFHQGNYHTHLRKLVQSSLSPEAIRKLIPDIEATAICTLELCAKQRTANTFEEMKKVCLIWIFDRII